MNRTYALVATWIVNVAYDSLDSDGTVTVALYIAPFIIAFASASNSNILPVWNTMMSFTVKLIPNVSPCFAYLGFWLLLYADMKSGSIFMIWTALSSWVATKA